MKLWSTEVFFDFEHLGGGIGQTVDVFQQHCHFVLPELLQQARITL
jgi:hypothetical protein